MKSSTDKHLASMVKKHRVAIFFALVILVIGLKIIFGPQTVASGNGYSHKIGSFGECEMNFSDCTKNATHRLHNFFYNEDYCDPCWEGYGESMFERLSGVKTTSGGFGIDYDEYKCRHTGCKNKARYSNWDKRFCSEHLQGTKYCRHPHCSELIPINGLSNYCSKHG